MMLEGKVLLVTGAGSGIGRATAIAAAQEGARLLVSDQHAGPAEETAALVRSGGGEALSMAADISNAAQVAAMVERTVASYGRIDCAFNNAGVAAWQVGAAGKLVGEISEEAFVRILSVNVIGTWQCMKAQIAQMQRQGGGVIVNTASIAGLVGMPKSGAYVASKHALIGLSKSAAIEYAQDGIRINCVCPGFVDTPFLQSALALHGQKLVESVPLRRIGTPDDIAGMVLWLLSAKAGYVTGGAFPVDGGVMAT